MVIQVRKQRVRSVDKISDLYSVLAFFDIDHIGQARNAGNTFEGLQIGCQLIYPVDRRFIEDVLGLQGDNSEIIAFIFFTDIIENTDHRI